MQDLHRNNVFNCELNCYAPFRYALYMRISYLRAALEQNE